MNISDLAALMGKSISEVETMLKEQDTVEVKLSDGKMRNNSDSGMIEVLN